MADDLRHFLTTVPAKLNPSPSGLGRATATKPSWSGIQPLDTPAHIPVTPVSGSQFIRVVPKGLRSFDAGDADFFLELLPGPRDREGLPDGIRFWKTGVEETDPDNTFCVGLIYGPSGCGKSSLVKAGLLPRLAKSVTAVYVEATGEETESRLLKGLRRAVPDLPDGLALVESLAALRRGQLQSGRKVLLVLDQFEQWLHAKRSEENTELVQALRQCDGGRLQAVVMVRDDFWLAVSRFMQALEIRILEGSNSRLVDLFDPRHARKVLTAFGRAFGALPDADLPGPMDPSVQALLGRLAHLSDEYSELRDGVQKAVQVADVDPEMALTRTRKVLEYVVRDVYQRRIGEPAGTRPLENLLQRLVKDGHFSDRLDAYANTIRKLGNVGTHTFGEKVAVADVRQSLTQLVLILEWYFEVERPEGLADKQTVGARPSRDLENAPAAAEEHRAFLEQSVSGLAQDGKVICVRLALFAEMMKGKPWTPATLEEVGGTEGIGVTFLEGTFSAAAARPGHRRHQKAARAVLSALLPEAGTDIKGTMRSHQELSGASGYAGRPGEFDDLLRILDSELRLITPTDPEGKDDADPSTPAAGARYYQLTHDYLVPSLRDWLTRKQKETRRGRAELMLADRAAVWNARPENRQLPSLLQWVQIRWHTRKQNWTPPQRKMMARAGRHHALRCAVAGVLAAAVTMTALGVRQQAAEQRQATRAAGLVQSLLNAETAQVPALVSQMAPYRAWTDPLLRDEYGKARPNSRPQLHAGLALLPVDESLVPYLYGRLLDADPHEVGVLLDALAPHKQALLDKLWRTAAAPERGKEPQRLRAAAALAGYDAESGNWAKAQEAVCDDLVAVPAVYLSLWVEALRPVRLKLLPALSTVYRDPGRRETERSLATDVLADYAADQTQLLADLLMDADEKQFAVLYAKLKVQGDRALPLLTAEVDRKLPAELPSSDAKRERLARRQANAAAALLRMGQPEKVWPLLRHTPPDDPRVRSYLIHRLSVLGADAGALAKRLDDEPDISVRRALLLALGEFTEADLLPGTRTSLLPKVQGIYRTDADPGLHAASEWLLRTWKQEDWLSRVNEEWAKDATWRTRRIEGIRQHAEKDGAKAPQWYVNGQGQTMVAVPGPVKFLMGSPLAEQGRQAGELLHMRRITRTFALAAKPVTVAQYRRFDNGYAVPPEYAGGPDLPAVNVDWYMAASYCNWLSEREGIPRDQWCYESDAKGQVLRLKESYLGLKGYRLPSEAEVEYATRAGTTTSRYYGETEDLLYYYAWYTKNSEDRPWPVGMKKPNDLGFFDLHGNVAVWCQERYRDYPALGDGDCCDDKEDILILDPTTGRGLRGGSFSDRPRFVRSADRYGVVPTNRDKNIGFRPARTYLP
jgi:formylglycine-generating enzyme required for sulfatase activity